MSEFKNRIETQRETLVVVNSKGLYEEPLMSLSEKSINRWVSNNNIDINEAFVTILMKISGSLFFLANKSQEQITEDYKAMSEKVSKYISNLELNMANKAFKRN